MASVSNPRVGIIGIGQSEFRAHRDDASYPDLVREAVALALSDAGLGFEDIEAVVYSLSPDAMVGIGNAPDLSNRPEPMSWTQLALLDSPSPSSTSSSW